MTLTDLFLQSTSRFAHYPALTMRMGYRTVTLTYADVERVSMRVASLLEAAGVGKGDCVLLCAPNSPLWVCVFWGCVLRGAIVVPLATQSTQQIIDKIAAQVNPKLFFKSQTIGFTVQRVKTIVMEQQINLRSRGVPAGAVPALPVLTEHD